MREKDRIVRILEAVGQLWDKFPNHRLGQLLANFVFGHNTDIFFQKDDHTEQVLEKAVEFYNRAEKKNANFKKTGKAKSRNP